MAHWKIPIAIFSLSFIECSSWNPTVIVEHQLGSSILVRNVRFQGCVWPEPIQIGQKTIPRNCLPGQARVYYEAFDFNEKNSQVWVGYQTKSLIDTTSTDEISIVLTLDQQELDVNAPGRFGH